MLLHVSLRSVSTSFYDYEFFTLLTLWLIIYFSTKHFAIKELTDGTRNHAILAAPIDLEIKANKEIKVNKETVTFTLVTCSLLRKTRNSQTIFVLLFFF